MNVLVSVCVCAYAYGSVSTIHLMFNSQTRKEAENSMTNSSSTVSTAAIIISDQYEQNDQCDKPVATRRVYVTAIFID